MIIIFTNKSTFRKLRFFLNLLFNAAMQNIQSLVSRTLLHSTMSSLVLNMINVMQRNFSYHRKFVFDFLYSRTCHWPYKCSRALLWKHIRTFKLMENCKCHIYTQTRSTSKRYALNFRRTINLLVYYQYL